MEDAFGKMLPILRKAAITPEQISRGEKNFLQFRPSPQEEDATVKARTSSESSEDLVRKCLFDGAVSSLTDDELKILSEGVQPILLSSADAMIEIQEKQTAEVQAMIDQAYNNITNPGKKEASLAAIEEITRRAKVARAERLAQRVSQSRRALMQSIRTGAAARSAPYPNSASKRTSEVVQRYALKKSQSTNLQDSPQDGIWGFVCLRRTMPLGMFSNSDSTRRFSRNYRGYSSQDTSRKASDSSISRTEQCFTANWNIPDSLHSSTVSRMTRKLYLTASMATSSYQSMILSCILLSMLMSHSSPCTMPMPGLRLLPNVSRATLESH
jgi:hypothetical protein